MADCLGWTSIFWAQPCVSARTAAAAKAPPPADQLWLNFVHLLRPEILEELSGGLQLELRVRGFYAEKETVLRGELKSRHVEDRMIR
jgi:hypothetical protein